MPQKYFTLPGENEINVKVEIANVGTQNGVLDLATMIVQVHNGPAYMLPRADFPTWYKVTDYPAQGEPTTEFMYEKVDGKMQLVSNAI